MDFRVSTTGALDYGCSHKRRGSGSSCPVAALSWGHLKGFYFARFFFFPFFPERGWSPISELRIYSRLNEDDLPDVRKSRLAPWFSGAREKFQEPRVSTAEGFSVSTEEEHRRKPFLKMVSPTSESTSHYPLVSPTWCKKSVGIFYTCSLLILCCTLDVTKALAWDDCAHVKSQSFVTKSHQMQD